MKPLYTTEDEQRLSAVPERESLPEEPYRSAYRRDYARLIHSAAFRRLQGKTQVFPGIESDFFRNRLTHSLEVAQIAKSIAIRLNHVESYFSPDEGGYPINTDIVEAASLAHDLGHPPFGHNGEKALDDAMKECGGFEGNAQTLRIIARLEKKEPINDSIGYDESGNDIRLGLNWTYRSLAAILKYDHQIEHFREQNHTLTKGYYQNESDIVKQIKQHVLQSAKEQKLKTIECAVMDIADDIAYSTYDLEDTFKAGFLDPLAILSIDRKYFGLIERVQEKVSRSLERDVPIHEIFKILREIFSSVLIGHDAQNSTFSADELPYISYASANIAANGYLRTAFTSYLVSSALSAISVQINTDEPAVSKVLIDEEVHISIEVLKHLTYELTIMSPRMRVSENRGFEIVTGLFKRLVNDTGHRLLPEDFKLLHCAAPTPSGRRRAICDFIAGMTDRYAIEFYGRLYSDEPQSIFKPI